MNAREKLIDTICENEFYIDCGDKLRIDDSRLADALIAEGIGFCEIVKPYEYERFGKNGQSYSLKCGRCDKTLQTKWNYCPFCGAKFREVKDERE